MRSVLKWLLISVATAGMAGCRKDLGQAKDFEVIPIEDQARKVTLADFKGKTVLLDFWATWCGPCRDSMPEIQAVWNKYHSKGFEVVSISNEDRQTILAFHKMAPFTYPVYHDLTGAATSAYAVDSLPRFILIQDGMIVWDQAGFEKGDIVRAVREAMN